MGARWVAGRGRDVGAWGAALVLGPSLTTTPGEGRIRSHALLHRSNKIIGVKIRECGPKQEKAVGQHSAACWIGYSNHGRGWTIRFSKYNDSTNPHRTQSYNPPSRKKEGPLQGGLSGSWAHYEGATMACLSRAKVMGPTCLGGLTFPGVGVRRKGRPLLKGRTRRAGGGAHRSVLRGARTQTARNGGTHPPKF